MGKSKKYMDTGGNNNLLGSVVTAVFGHYIKYYMKCYSTQTVKHVSMHLRSCCQLKQR